MDNMRAQIIFSSIILKFFTVIYCFVFSSNKNIIKVKFLLLSARIASSCCRKDCPNLGPLHSSGDAPQVSFSHEIRILLVSAGLSI